jgi:hypothetical protein
MPDHPQIEPSFHKWKPQALRECDWCHGQTDTLYDIPDAAPTGEVDCVCLRCALLACPVNRAEADKVMNRLSS